MVQRWVKWTLIWGCWTTLALIFATQSYLYLASRGERAPWRAVLLWGLSEWYTVAVLSPLIFWVARRFRIERDNWRRAVPVHLAAGLVFAILQAVLQAAVKYFGLGGDLRPRPYGIILAQLLYTKSHFNYLTYWVIVGISHAAEYYRRYRERELAASQLEALLNQSELKALRMQLHPHFLFNALNSISSLIDEDPKSAKKMLARLGDFLRLTLSDSGVQETSLHRELEFLKSYLEIEQFRFEDRLSVSMEIDPQSLDARVPNLILQPIVENAIKHGVAPRESGGHITIRAMRYAAVLYLQVRDDGPGLHPQRSVGELFDVGVGLSNTKDRLQNLYGHDYRFELENAPHGGLIVTLEIPFKRPSTQTARTLST
jgi:signal transduction histidine kinase